MLPKVAGTDWRVVDLSNIERQRKLDGCAPG